MGGFFVLKVVYAESLVGGLRHLQEIQAEARLAAA
jgi:hypothetical protein